MWHITSAGVPDSASDVVSASVTAALSAEMLDQSVAVSSVSQSAPAASSESRRYGAANRPCSHAWAGPSPSDVPPWASSSARVSACLLSACSLVPSNSGRSQAAAGDLVFADRLGGGEVDAGLGLVGKPHDGGAGAGLDDRAQRRGPGREVREGPRLVAGGFRHRVHPQPHLGDDAEACLPSRSASWRRSGPAADSATRPRSSTPTGVTTRSPQNHVVEPAVTGRVLAGRPGRREAADGGVLEALREVPQREAAFAEQAFGIRAGDAGAEFGDAGHLVERMQLVEAAQIQRDHRAELAAGGIEPADDAGAAAERDDGDAVLGAVAQDRGDRASSSPGSSTASGASWTPRSLRRSMSGVDLPPACSSRSRSAVRQVLGPDDFGQPFGSACDSADGRSFTWSSSSSASSESSSPTACFSKDRIPSESGLAAAGSPHAFHFIGGR